MLKQVITNFINHNNSIIDFRNRTSEEYQNGKEVIPIIVSKLEDTKFNSQIGQDFVEILQLSDNEDICNQFDLTDISNLYDSLRKLQEANLETIIESSYFEFSIMDNPTKAKDIAVAGIEMAQRKINELNTLLGKIAEEQK